MPSKKGDIFYPKLSDGPGKPWRLSKVKYPIFRLSLVTFVHIMSFPVLNKIPENLNLKRSNACFKINFGMKRRNYVIAVDNLVMKSSNFWKMENFRNFDHGNHGNSRIFSRESAHTPPQKMKITTSRYPRRLSAIITLSTFAVAQRARVKGLRSTTTAPGSYAIKGSARLGVAFWLVYEPLTRILCSFPGFRGRALDLPFKCPSVPSIVPPPPDNRVQPSFNLISV